MKLDQESSNNDKELEEIPTRLIRRANSKDEKERRRQEILIAAKKVFAEYGYNSTSISDIAKVANLSYGSVYWYFDSKESLFQELMTFEEDELRVYIQNQINLNSKNFDPPSALIAAIEATLIFFESNKELLRLLFRDSLALGDRFEAHLYNIYSGFSKLIEKNISYYQKKGNVIQGSPKLIAFAITSLITQFAHRRFLTDDNMTAHDLAVFITELIMFGIIPRQNIIQEKG